METVAEAEKTTTIRVTTGQWARLNALMVKPGDKMSDVIERLLNERRQPPRDEA